MTDIITNIILAIVFFAGIGIMITMAVTDVIFNEDKLGLRTLFNGTAFDYYPD